MNRASSESGRLARRWKHLKAGQTNHSTGRVFELSEMQTHNHDALATHSVCPLKEQEI
jgi:hypothetical protein